MRTPESLVPLVDHGVVDEVVRSLKSGKEADVYLVASEGFYRVAKVYKDAQSRSFKNRSAYTEGRQVRSSRDQRAMDKGSKYGKAQNEAAWQSAEVDMIYRLDAAGVRVPKPYHFIDGVLIMELVATDDGQPAPRLGEMEFSADEAKAIFVKLLADTVKMLAAGVVHGDLSEFNVLVAAEGPVIIDFPQSVNASKNQNARKMLMRDVQNLQDFLKRCVPGTPQLHYAEEMWQLYEKGELTAESQLSGKWIDDRKQANTSAVLGLIDEARRDERFKRQQTGRNFRGLGGGNHAAAQHASEPAKPAAGNPAPAPAHPAHPPRPPPQQNQRPQPPGPRPQEQQQRSPRPPHPGQRPPPHPQGARPPHPQAARPPPHPQGARPPHPQAARPPHPQAARPPHPQGARPPQQQSPRHAQHPNPRPQPAPNPAATASPQPRHPHAARPPQHSGKPPNGSGSNPARAPQPPRPNHPRARPNPIVETKPVLPRAIVISRPPPRK